MKISSISFFGAIASLALVLLILATPAHADTYTIYNLGNANYNSIYGIDTSGQVVIYDSAFCQSPGGVCYTTYDHGTAVAVTDVNVAPTLDYDNGTPCSSLPSGYNIFKSACNNGHIGFGSAFNSNGDPNGVYTGLDSSITFLQNGSADQLDLNSSGDFAWVSGAQEYIYEAVDTTSTPEPSTLLLMATGIFIFSFTLRRKLRA
jgi:hypothetical protein